MNTRKTIEVPIDNTRIELEVSPSGEVVGGVITSDIGVDAIESLLLAHACAGIDVTSPGYLEGVETTLGAIGNHEGYPLFPEDEMKASRHYAWREPQYKESGEFVRLVVPWSDPYKHEISFNFIFETEEKAMEALKIWGAEDDAREMGWVLVEVTTQGLGRAPGYEG